MSGLHEGILSVTARKLPHDSQWCRRDAAWDCRGCFVLQEYSQPYRSVGVQRRL